MNSQAKPQLLPLTSLRFVAALLIVVHHLKGHMWLTKETMESFNFGAAVSFFFVLSGFVLQYSYGESSKKINWIDFSIIRFFRIWPLHVVVLIITWVWLDTDSFAYQLSRISFVEISAIALLMQSWIPDDFVYFALNGPSWSISTELFFYVSFPALSYLLTRSARIFVFCVVLQTVVWLTIAIFLNGNSNDEMYAVGLVYINPLARLAEFAAGMLAARLYERYNLPVRAPRQVVLFTALEFGVLVIAVLISVSTHFDSYFMSTVIDNVFGSLIRLWISISSGLVIYPFIIIIFSLQIGLLSNFLKNPIFVWLGTIIFSLYLVHLPIILYWKNTVSKHIDSVAISVVLFAISLILMSALLHALVEKTGLRFAKMLVLKMNARPQSIQT